MSCFFDFDRTGFPYLRLPALGLSVSVLPIAKLQYEQYLADADTPESDTRYSQMLRLNPRVSPARCCAENREQVLLTGLTAQELEAFARWSGSEFRIPTVTEWRNIYHKMQAIPVPDFTHCIDRPVIRELFTRLNNVLAPQTALDFSLMRGGVMEWVRQDREWVHLGAPRHEFWHNLWNPLVECVRNVHLRLCGGRLVMNMVL